jgi:NAD(P)H-flavin reductase
MIRDALIHRPRQEILLFYGNRSIADSPLLSDILELQMNHPQFKVIPVLAEPPSDWTGETGFITDEMISRHVADMDTPIFYACGSPAMVAAMQGVLAELAIPADRIKVEDFPGY